ncbi:MAG TPA: ankyrin repeat domain-containing protein [Candidatus Wallbacteria bacterium]|nr:ankyrin repeat domain-containing protein [Candidatus Wallbacteria bacterium]
MVGFIDEIKNKFNTDVKKNDQERSIKNFREILGITQSELANLLGVSDTAVNRWESGSLKIDARYSFKLKMLEAVCDSVTAGKVDVYYIKKMSKNSCYSIERIYEKLVCEGMIDSAKYDLDPDKILCLTKNELRPTLMSLIKHSESDDETSISSFIARKPESVNEADSDGRTPLMEAAYRGYVKIATLLIGAGADVNQKAPLFRSADDVKFLFYKNKKKDTTNWGTTALHQVFMLPERSKIDDKILIAERLLAAGADVNTVGENGQTPLFLAAINGFPLEALKLLLSKKADPNATFDCGTSCTPMMAAILYEKYEQAKFLIEATNLNVRDADGHTALHYAVGQGANDIVEMLLKKDADKSIKNSNGETPADLARKIKSPTLKLLE